VGAGVVERGEINGDILEHKWPILTLLPCFVKDDGKRGDLPSEYGNSCWYLKDEVYACETDMIGSSKDELDEKDRVEGESNACEEDLYWKRAGKDGAIRKVRVCEVATVYGLVRERKRLSGNVIRLTHV
jgi:hypothetical protein